MLTLTRCTQSLPQGFTPATAESRQRKPTKPHRKPHRPARPGEEEQQAALSCFPFLSPTHSRPESPAAPGGFSQPGDGAAPFRPTAAAGARLPARWRPPLTDRAGRGERRGTPALGPARGAGHPAPGGSAGAPCSRGSCEGTLLQGDLRGHPAPAGPWGHPAPVGAAGSPFSKWELQGHPAPAGAVRRPCGSHGVTLFPAGAAG